MSNDNNQKDEIYNKKKEESLTTISFLLALKENLDQETAFKIAKDAFTKYMTTLYKKILSSTKEGSQERFDRFRNFYVEYSKKVPYLKIIESSPKFLKVKYTRCPFFEILKDLEIEDMAYAFCLSDPAFTKNVLPSVHFTRNHEIAKGDLYCDNTWEFFQKNS